MKILKVPAISWFTTLKTDNNKRKQLILTKTYNEKDYQKYDSFDIINVDKIKDIPDNYYKLIGVPLTILCYNLEDWNVIDSFENQLTSCLKIYKSKTCLTTINNKIKYTRIIIERKKNGKQ